MGSILINGISAKSGGGKSILVNFLSLLRQSHIQDKFVVVVPPDKEYLNYSKNNVRIIPLKNSNFSLFTFYFSTIRKIINKHDVSIIFSIADVIAPVSTTQICLFDWPYAIYPESIAWKRMTRKEWLFRKFKLFLIKRWIHLPALMVAQTEVSEKRLRRIFSLNNTKVVPNAVSLDNLTGGDFKDFNLPKDKIKFLYLTKYYSHKNIEVFLSLARIIRQEKLPYIIVITISNSQHVSAKKFLQDLANEQLEEIVINVGPVSMENVPSLYQQTNALLMPTLIESFSGTYVEAMYHGKPIFTSDLDFARVICGDAAFYFDPLNPNSIFDTLRMAYSNPGLIASKLAISRERLQSLPSWQQVFETFIEIIDEYKHDKAAKKVSNMHELCDGYH
jgi:glycosyltransferase involved in cell wall biosynthesis